MPKMVHFGEFLKTFGQTVLPDRSVLIGQKLVENAKIQNIKCDILSVNKITVRLTEVTYSSVPDQFFFTLYSVSVPVP